MGEDTKKEEGDVEFTIPDVPQSYGPGEMCFVIAQLITIIFFAIGVEFDEGVHVFSTMPEMDARDKVQNIYPAYQDVHVMIFIGFGFLMTFIKANSLSALCYNWVISVWALQWAILSNGFWWLVFGPDGGNMIKISLSNMLIADFAAGTAMITYGAILGKCNLQQLIFLVTGEMIFWGFNEALCVNKLHATDMGGSMFVHTFGAYFGVAASYFFQPNRAAQSKNCQSNYFSEMGAMIGSVFLWMFWPSFNSGLASGATQHRVMINTVLAISGSVIGGVNVSRIFFGKLEMEIILNATLAGGVAIGSASDIITSPWASIFIGYWGGVLSALGFQKIGPYLAKEYNLQDTCGVHSLHGMPGVMGGLVSAIAIAAIGLEGFPEGYFPIENANAQAKAQMWALMFTLAVALSSGALCGFLASFDIWQPPRTLFRDDDHIDGVQEKYPKEFLNDVDEEYEETKASYQDVIETLKNIRTNFTIYDNEDAAIDKVVEKLWDDQMSDDDEEDMSKDQTHEFFKALVKKFEPSQKMSEEAFEKIFDQMNPNEDESIQKEDLAGFIKANSK